MMNYYMCDEFHDSVKIFESWTSLLEISGGNPIPLNEISALWDELAQKHGKSSKEDRFFYILQNYSKDPSTPSLKEWDLFGQHHSEEEDGERCICSQHIAHLLYFKNRNNGTIIQVGNTCVNKFGSDFQKIKLKKFLNDIKTIEKRKKNIEEANKIAVENQEKKTEQQQINAEYYEANKERILKTQSEIIARCKANLDKYGPHYY